MKKISTKLLLAAAIAVSFTACYETVPPGAVGKVKGASGFQPEIYPPSRIWLDTTFTMVPEELFLVETTTKKYGQPIQVLLQDKLTLKADVVFRARISGSDKVINSIFNDIKLNKNVVTVDDVYDIYGRMIVMNTAREVLSKYNVDEVNKNYARITTELYNAIKPKLEGLPIVMSEVTLGNIQYPDIVTKAIEQAKEKQMAIEKTEAEVQIRLAEAKGREEVAKAEYRVKMLEAKRIRDYNTMTAAGITKEILQLRELEVREKELDKWDGKLPTTLMGANTPVIVNSK